MKIEWKIPAGPPSPLYPAGTREEVYELDLGERETAMLRGYWHRIKPLGPGPERTALIEELRVQMDMIAVFDAEITDEPESQLVAVAAGDTTEVANEHSDPF